MQVVSVVICFAALVVLDFAAPREKRGYGSVDNVETTPKYPDSTASSDSTYASYGDSPSDK